MADALSGCGRVGLCRAEGLVSRISAHTDGFGAKPKIEGKIFFQWTSQHHTVHAVYQP